MGIPRGAEAARDWKHQLGLRVGHIEACRLRIEEAIGGDEDYDRTKKAKERLDHYTAQCFEAAEKRGNNLRQEEEPKKEDAPDGGAGAAMDTEPEICVRDWCTGQDERSG